MCLSGCKNDQLYKGWKLLFEIVVDPMLMDPPLSQRTLKGNDKTKS